MRIAWCENERGISVEISDSKYEGIHRISDLWEYLSIFERDSLYLPPGEGSGESPGLVGFFVYLARRPDSRWNTRKQTQLGIKCGFKSAPCIILSHSRILVTLPRCEFLSILAILPRFFSFLDNLPRVRI
ncbi:Uncharacterized protein HZ326_15682 [Fusarium oxysporum f. sp. albedinis]|nr:Uncharacterized protein HZ326_15682 [Fusarium oxysporum f. sp. albedinis]